MNRNAAVATKISLSSESSPPRTKATGPHEESMTTDLPAPLKALQAIVDDEEIFPIEAGLFEGITKDQFREQCRTVFYHLYDTWKLTDIRWISVSFLLASGPRSGCLPLSDSFPITPCQPLTNR